MAGEPGTVAVVVAHGIGNQLPLDTVRALDIVFGEKSGLESIQKNGPTSYKP